MLLAIITLLGVAAISFYCASYALWAWRNGYRRGALGTLLIATITLVLPVAVWFYHNARF